MNQATPHAGPSALASQPWVLLAVGGGARRRRGTAGLASPTYTLSPGTDRQRFGTEPHAAGQDAPAFADVIRQTFTCTADGQTVQAGRTRWCGENTVWQFPALTVGEACGQFTANRAWGRPGLEGPQAGAWWRGADMPAEPHCQRSAGAASGEGSKTGTIRLTSCA